MADVITLQSSPLSDLDLNSLNWMRFEGSPKFDYPINYSMAVLNARPEAGTIDFLARWEPNSYCHFHRHLGETTILVLKGEHHVVETTANQTVHKIRQPGFSTRNPGGDVHMEYGGAAGTLVFFSMQAVEGHLFEVLDKNENILSVVTMENLITGRFGR